MTTTIVTNRLDDVLRLRVIIHGAVQGVGFRPFVFQLANKFNLKGWVENSCQGVLIEAEGDLKSLQSFFLDLETEKPENAVLQNIESVYLDPAGYKEFKIRQSDTEGEKTALILPDIATCQACTDEIFNPSDRRYLYPFTNCTHCGPRFSIIEALPYDRSRTTMKDFSMCGSCLNEYGDPANRRFHAQPNACAVCGPHLELWDRSGKILARRHDALLECAEMIRQGYILAVKSLGGFQLMTLASSDTSLHRLRTAKSREEKPFALMYPGMTDVKKDCFLSVFEEKLLLSPARPIVLLKHKDQISISCLCAPQNSYLGIMLPYTPIHHILMKELDMPVVATSGNLSEEPIITDELEALEKMHNIADFFLVHNRPIARHVDDSIVRMMAGREMILRRARGYAPLPVRCQNTEAGYLSAGGHLKNTIAVSGPNLAFLSQHIGNLETLEAYTAFRKTIQDFKDLYNLEFHAVACDAHPDYISTKHAGDCGLRVIPIQHHYAHILSCMAENEVEDSVLGIAWDGTGFGLDETIWGGEFLEVGKTDFARFARFKTFPLPGADKAAQEPRRSALGLLYEIYQDRLFEKTDVPPLLAFSTADLSILQKMLEENVNCPRTSSAGRIFDAVASLINLRQISRYEGQAAMELEFLAEKAETNDAYSFQLIPSSFTTGSDKHKNPIFEIDLKNTMDGILDDMKRGLAYAEIAAKFHNTLVEIIISTARKSGYRKIVLSGGCFQNRYLTEHALKRLKEESFCVYTHQRIPPNDGGIALGQLMGLFRALKKETAVCA